MILRKLSNLIKSESARLDRIERVLNENNWADIFNNTISSSDWLKDKSFSPGRWAAGYPFLYILYRILDEFCPKSILELGLGQTTKMISQYTISHISSHKLFEHDKVWIDICSKKMNLSKTDIINNEIETLMIDGHPVTVYKDFSSKVKGEKFDFICIDAPFGSEYVSRIDILDVIPMCLDKSFVIVIDDCERMGEMKMIEMLLKKLDSEKINYCHGFYSGIKRTDIIVSKDLHFFTSL